MNKFTLVVFVIIGLLFNNPTSSFSQTGENDNVQTIIDENGNEETIYLPKLYDFGDIYNEPAINVQPEEQEMPRTLSGINEEIDYTKYVGHIEFSEAVTPNGGKTYSIPVVTAPSPSSSPQIALTYNSQSAHGVAGFGWHLSGLSSIAVGAKTEYYDGAPSPINLSHQGHNAYFLDGIRLVQNNRITEFIDYQYQTVQGYVLVKKNVENDVITSFTVRYPNGNIATYGFPSNTQNQLVYPLTSIVDIKGYRMDFQYNFSPGGVYYINKISYGGKTTPSHFNHISFTYKDRTNPIALFEGGKQIKDDKLLTTIASYSDGALMRTYT